MPDIVKLRPHHLLCILTYIGEGYSKSFTENFDNIVANINAGKITKIEIVDGPDDVCAPRLCDKTDNCHCLDSSISERDKDALKDIGLQTGTTIEITPTFWMGLRQDFIKNKIRSACEECEWAGLCNSISENGFKSSSLK